MRLGKNAVPAVTKALETATDQSTSPSLRSGSSLPAHRGARRRTARVRSRAVPGGAAHGVEGGAARRTQRLPFGHAQRPLVGVGQVGPSHVKRQDRADEQRGHQEELEDATGASLRDEERRAERQREPEAQLARRRGEALGSEQRAARAHRDARVEQQPADRGLVAREHGRGHVLPDLGEACRAERHVAQGEQQRAQRHRDEGGGELRGERRLMRLQDVVVHLRK